MGRLLRQRLETYLRRLRFLKTPDSVRLRLIVILTLAIAPPAALSINQSISDYRREITAIESNLVQSAEIATDAHENLITGTQYVLTALAAQESIRLSLQPACRDALAAVGKTFPQYGGLVVVDRTGRVSCADDHEREGIDVSDRPWFRAIMEARDLITSDIVDSRLTSTRSIVTAVPLQGPNGEVTGAVAASLSLVWLVAMPRHIELPEDAFTMLIDGKGQALSLEESTEGNVVELPYVDLTMAARASSIAVLRARDKNDRELILAVTPPLSQQVRFVLGRPAESVFSASRLKLAGRLAIPFLILIATILAAWIAGNRMFVRWIVYLQRFAGIYAGGRYSVRPQNLDAAPAELRHLGESLSQMMEAISKRDAQLKDELTHREMLIKEIHHRVKNNLQIIASLLNLQARRLNDDAAKAAMLDLRRRIDTLALVHRSIYEAHDLAHVDLKAFFESLGAQLTDLVGIGQRDISLSIDVPSRSVSPDVAIALAMMVTEAVTNAYRHAFSGRRAGRIAVRVSENVDGSAVLTITDDGIGFDTTETESRASWGLGRTLMEGIARQLRGTLTIAVSDGTTVRLDVPQLA